MALASEHVNDDFEILFGFYEQRAAEVGGRTATIVPTDVREKLARFASGSCSEEERDEVKQLLQEQPDLIPALVVEIVALRRAAQ